MALNLRSFSQDLAKINGFIYARETPRFRLLDLPVELQDIIFRLCLATGNTDVLLLSKNIHTRVVHFLYRDAYLRLYNANLRMDHNPGIFNVHWPLPPSKMSLIQKISIDFDNGFLKELLDHPYITGIDFTLPLWNPNTQARTFHIGYWRKDEVLKNEAHVLGKLIAGLTTFEFVTVTAITEIVQRAGEPGILYQPNARVFRARNSEVYNMFRQEWEGTLGPAKFFDGLVQEERYLEFRPRKHLASVAADSD